MSHTEDAEEKGRRVVLGMTCTAPTTTTPTVPENLKPLLLKQQTQAVNDRIPAKGCRHLNGTGKGNPCQLCESIINDKGEITGTSKAIQRRLMTAERTLHSNRTVGGRTELDLVQDEIDEAKRLLEEAHVEVQAAQNKVTEAAFRVGQAMEEMAQIRKLLEANSEPAGLCGQARRSVCWAASRRQKPCGKRRYEAILEEISKDITAQCVDFCEATTSKVHAVLQHAPSDLRGGTFLQHPRVLVATVDYEENPHLCMHILHAAMFQVFRGAHILLRVLAVTESQETQWFLDEIQQQPSVSVLSGPVIGITNVATVSAFLADGWSTESVSLSLEQQGPDKETMRGNAQNTHITATHTTR